jgi:ABC-type lipoprotein release transport system permease subunit
VEDLPRLLGLFLGGLAALALLHALVQTSQRRRTELGVLRAIGFTRGQVSGAIGWQATALAGLATVLGLPLGIAVGRWVWTFVAQGLGVVPRPTFGLALFLLVPCAALVAAAAGAMLGALAGRTPAAVALRTE